MRNWLRLSIAFTLGAAASVPGAESAGWRGDGSGCYPSAAPVSRWSATENVLWKTEVGAGHSSPIIVGRRVFLTAEPDLLVCLDVETGQPLWRQAHADAKGSDRSSEYGDATPTPVSDGRRVWVFFGSGMVACHEVDGARLWSRWHDLPQSTSYGRTASPVLIGDRLLVHFGPLVCLEASSGTPLWTNHTAKASYGTPAPTRIGEVDVVITPKGHLVRVADGHTLATDLGNCTYTSPVVRDGMVYFIDGDMTAVRLPAKAASSIECKESWAASLTGDFYASPIVHGGRIHTIDKAATHYVIDARTGKTLSSRQLELTPAARGESAHVYPSLCLAGNRLFASNDAGDTLLLEPDERATPVGVNRLPGGSGGTPVFSGKRMLARSGKLLYCIGEK